uniref:F-box domain-containing protein n=1 Tax=Meloidogyne enterolobii TaxID=390850 RepID=A0A6V7V1M1_MELEN|nr:unnamed protein product [Meloidogyne enterolobii]
MKNIPVEVQLDILKFLDYKQLYSFQLINKQLNNLIDKYNNELALKGFFSFEIIPDTKVVLSECKRATNIAKEFKKRYGNEMIYNMELNDCQKMKWENLLKAKIRLFWSSELNDNINQSNVGSCVLFIRKNYNIHNQQEQPSEYYYEPFHGISSDQVRRNNMSRDLQQRVVRAHLQLNVERYQQLCLELPIYPKTMEELKFICFWLWQLSRCSFREIDFDKIIF